MMYYPYRYHTPPYCNTGCMPGHMTTLFVQERLNELGFYYGMINGVMGPETTEAVREFQRSRGIHVNGIPGWQTMRALGWR